MQVMIEEQKRRNGKVLPKKNEKMRGKEVTNGMSPSSILKIIHLNSA